MAQIVKGNIMGIGVYGEIDKKDVENFNEFIQNVRNLKNSLAKLFNEQVAEMVIRQMLGETNIQIMEGEEENREEWERLHRQGMVFKKSRTEDNVRSLINAEMLTM